MKWTNCIPKWGNYQFYLGTMPLKAVPFHRYLSKSHWVIFHVPNGFWHTQLFIMITKCLAFLCQCNLNNFKMTNVATILSDHKMLMLTFISLPRPTLLITPPQVIHTKELSHTVGPRVLQGHSAADHGLLRCSYMFINSSPPGQNGRHLGRRQFQLHFLEWKWFSIKISLTFVPGVQLTISQHWFR